MCALTNYVHSYDTIINQVMCNIITICISVVYNDKILTVNCWTNSIYIRAMGDIYVLIISLL